LTDSRATSNLREGPMNLLNCHLCGCEFSGGEEFCPRDGTRLATSSRPADLAPIASVAPAAVDPLVGTTLDARYKVMRVIGEGGMGVVYEALHVLIEKRVAIKVLRDTFTSRPDVVERFRQEAKSASKIGHPNIVDVSDFGETPSGQSYIVMEMLTGEDVADVLSRERVLPPPRVVRIIYQVARALHATHKKNIVHRDLKPENIYLIECDGTQDIVKVVDFGVAKMNDIEVPSGGRKLTRTGMIFGTPEYMSPEQALGKAFDHRVDIYALGAILFELLSGRVPFTGENFMEILAHHGHTPVPPLRNFNTGLNISPALEAIVARSLEKDPALRYQSMGEFADDLRSTPEMPASERADISAPALWSLSSSAPTRIESPSPEALSFELPLPARMRPTPTRAPRGDTPPPLPVVRARSPVPPPARLNVARATPAPVYEVTQRVPRYETLSFDEAQAAVLISEGQPWPVRIGMRLGLLGLIVACTLVVAFAVQRLNGQHPVLTSHHAALDPLPPPAAQPAPTAQAVDEPPANSANADPAIHAQTQPPAPTPASETELARALPEGVSEAHDREHEPSNMVEVQVRTRPPGASVSAVGTDARCSAAPCALAVPRGRPITLRAETSTASVERTLTFEDKAEVELRVSSRKGAAGKNPYGKAQAVAPTRTPNDLKIPSIFR
jgi:serine/threonine protein kinase